MHALAEHTRSTLLITSLLLLGACSDAAHLRVAEDPTPTHAAPTLGGAPAAGRTLALDCPGGEVVDGTFDHVAGAVGEEGTALEIAANYATVLDKHFGGVEEISSRVSSPATRVAVLRKDGTVEAIVRLRSTGPDRWLIDGYEGCAS